MDKETSKRLVGELKEIAKRYNIVVWLGGQKQPTTSADNMIVLHRNEPTHFKIEMVKDKQYK